MPVIVTLLHILPTAQTGSPVLEAAWERFWFDLVIESAGIFWILAELAILYAVTVGRRALRERPLPKKLVLTPFERKLGVGFVVFGIALAGSVYGRFAIFPPMPSMLEAAAGVELREISSVAYAELLRHTRVHLAIWCAFVTGWVVLEIAIVAQGIRAFHALATLLRPKQRGPSAVASATLLIAIFSLGASTAAAQFRPDVEIALQNGYMDALDDAAVAHSFVEFYLRVAGAAWVIVEWIAALYLVRGYFMLRRLFKGAAHVA